jgi:membrane protease YdiL (CAAX protease family)
MSRRSLALVAFALVLAGALLGATRVRWHEQWDRLARERVKVLSAEVGTSAGEPVVVPLLEIEAPAQDVFVRLCGARALEELDEGEVWVALTGREAEAPRWREGPLSRREVGPLAPPDCLFFSGRGQQGGGALALGWAAGALGEREYLEAGVAVRHPLRWPDRAMLVLLLGGLGLLLVAGQRTRPLAERPPWTPGDMLTVVLVFFLASVAASMLAQSRATALLAGLFSYGAYVAACWLLGHRVAPGEPLGALAFHRVSARVWSLSAAIGLALAVAVSFVLLFVPQGESPMTEVLQTSGGMLSVITLALISPWSEELLLRGVIYGSLERWAGPLAAVLGSALVFSLLHLGQHWGNLAPWLTLTATGLVLSGVRWRTGSALASTVTHLTYNLALALPVLLAG